MVLSLRAVATHHLVSINKATHPLTRVRYERDDNHDLNLNRVIRPADRSSVEFERFDRTGHLPTLAMITRFGHHGMSKPTTRSVTYLNR
jgi:hypothetical protein